MLERNIYQTTEDRGNRNEVQSKGPFQCSRADAWLGEGCYYWETFKYYAHWWGRTAYDNHYFIAESKLRIDRSELYDLEDSETLLEFEECIHALKDGHEDLRISVSGALEYLRKNNLLKPKAIRARGTRPKSPPKKGRYIPFVSPCESYLDIYPQIQICIVDRSLIGINNYTIIHPPAEEKLVSDSFV